MLTWGQVLRDVRIVTGLSHQALANRVRYSKSYVGNVEAGRRRPSLGFAQACDDALGTSPLLVTLLGIDEGDDVRRRALMSAAGLAVGAGALGVTSLANMVRLDLWEMASGGVDYDAMVARYARQFVTNASIDFGQGLMAQLMVLRQRLKEDPSADALRATARLTELYGLWLGNRQQFAEAANWYTTASMLAARSGDVRLESYIYGRTANRTMFEGASIATVRDGVDRALSLTTSGPGRAEAYAARVCLSALMGDGAAGRRALTDMTNEVDRLEDHSVADLHERALFHRAYLETRVGTLDQAEAAYLDALTALAGLPYWLLETQLYWARAVVDHGDVAGGIDHALTVLEAGPEPIGVIQVAVRDVLSVVPTMHRSDELAALKSYASPIPGPWETLARS